MKKASLFILFCITTILTSCSETDIVDNEFANWQERNDAYFTSIYAKAKQAADNGDSSWKIIRAYTKQEGTANINDYIVAEVITDGGTTQTVNYTDSVSLLYQGRLMPSDSYPEGRIFTSTWTGDYDLETAAPVRTVLAGMVDGFTTAGMAMHPGDRWRVYIPYSLGYDANAKDDIPAYSTLIFDLTLLKAWQQRK